MYNYDLDSDYDLYVGSGYNGLQFYENEGDEYNALFIENNEFIFPHLGNNLSPEIYADNSNIGLISGCSTGGMFYIEFNSIQNSGDINNDEYINIYDVILLVEYLLSIDSSNSFYDYMDINNDNEINIIDVIQLVQLILFSI